MAYLYPGTFEMPLMIIRCVTRISNLGTSFCALSLPTCVFSQSRLLQGGALSDREETDAIRELEVRHFMHFVRHWDRIQVPCIIHQSICFQACSWPCNDGIHACTPVHLIRTKSVDDTYAYPLRALLKPCTFFTMLLCVISQRALGVLGHQRRFLREQKIGLETWTSDVYGFDLSSEGFPAIQDVSAALKEDRKPETLKEDTNQDAEHHQHAKTVLREVRLSVKCKGADKRRVDKTLLAQVDRTWSLRRPRPTDVKKADVKKRAPCKLAAEKPAKRSKPPVPKVELTAVVETVSVGSVVGDVVEDEPVKEASGAPTNVPDAPGQLWNWLEDSTYFSPISTRQPLPEDLTLEAEDRLGRSSGVPLNVSESAPETASEARASNGGWRTFCFLGGRLVATKSRLAKVTGIAK